MQLPARNKVIVSGVIFALVFCLTVRPVLNAADPDSSSLRNRDSLAENLFRYASELSAGLHGRPPEERSTTIVHTINESIDLSVFNRWHQDENYRPKNLVQWASTHGVKIEDLKASVKADNPHEAVGD